MRDKKLKITMVLCICALLLSMAGVYLAQNGLETVGKTIAILSILSGIYFVFRGVILVIKSD